MKHLDDKYFICIPEYFKDKDWDMEIYASTSINCFGFDKGVNVIFVKSDNIEEIKKVAITDLETIKKLNLSFEIKFTVAKIVDKLENEQPVEPPELEIRFDKGYESCEVSPEGNTLIIYMPGPEVLESKKVFFYPSEVFSEVKKN